MDFKFFGKSNYNNADFIRNKGFISQVQFEKGKFDEGVGVEQQSKNAKVSGFSARPSQTDIQKIAQEVDVRVQQLLKAEEELAARSKREEEIFNAEMKKLKQSEKDVKELHAYYQQQIKELEQKSNS